MTVVAITALTYRRPNGLRALLDGIFGQVGLDDIDVRLILIDNDEAGTGRPVLEAWNPPSWLQVTYAIEPRRGIASARNRSVALAGDVDFLAFIDDDEVPDPKWLAALLAAQRMTGADVVHGPVVPRFEHAPPSWAVAARCFERPTFPHLAPLHYAATNNALIRRASLPSCEPFDTRYDLAGGEDTNLFERLHRGGAQLRWSADAVVVEVVPPSRVRPSWVLRRSYRRGLTLSSVLIDLSPSPWRLARRAGGSMVAVGRGVARLVVAGSRGDGAAAIQAGRGSAYGLGLFVGMVGVRGTAYAGAPEDSTLPAERTSPTALVLAARPVATT